MTPLFTVIGIVVHGKKRGKAMGFPTANIEIDPSTPKGTYIAETVYKAVSYPSVMFVGTVDTFDETDFVGESYIIGFDKEIYGEEIIIKVLKKLRDNQKFESAGELIEQMKKDEIETIEYFKNLLNH